MVMTMVTGRLKFKKTTHLLVDIEIPEYSIFNSKKQHLGNLLLTNDIGKKQWLFYPDATFDGELYFASDCLIEIANKLRELNS